MIYSVKNTYDITGREDFQSVELALAARDKREGEGWIVEDEDGNWWDWDPNGEPVIVVRANGTEF